MSTQAQQLDAASEAVRVASVVCRSVQKRLDEVRAITKDDKSPVTVADFASQAIVARVLTQRLGEITLVAEEDADFLRDPENRGVSEAAVEAASEVWPEVDQDAFWSAIDVGGAEPGAGGYWTLDPIDGTKGFLRGQQYAIALAYIEDGTPTVGAMACPNLPRAHDAPLDIADAEGCVYGAVRGEGCSLLLDASSEPVRRDDFEGGALRVCASVEKAHSNVSDTDRILELIAQRSNESPGEPVRLDSQAKYAVTARGQSDAYLRLPTRKGYIERIWDHAAGALIASEAGCTVSDVFGRALDFSHGRGLENNRGIVCAPPSAHARLIDAIGELGLTEA